MVFFIDYVLSLAGSRVQRLIVRLSHFRKENSPDFTVIDLELNLFFLKVFRSSSHGCTCIGIGIPQGMLFSNNGEIRHTAS